MSDNRDYGCLQVAEILSVAWVPRLPSGSHRRPGLMVTEHAGGGEMDNTREQVDSCFEGQDIYIRQWGWHYHVDPGCPMVRNPFLSDPYYTTSFQLGEEGCPDLRNWDGITYVPCQCAFVTMHGVGGV